MFKKLVLGTAAAALSLSFFAVGAAKADMEHHMMHKRMMHHMMMRHHMHHEMHRMMRHRMMHHAM